jgi:hypothetical protein
MPSGTARVPAWRKAGGKVPLPNPASTHPA